MADAIEPRSTASTSTQVPASSNNIEKLRAQAQAHLIEIEKEKADEDLQRITRAKEIEMYTKPKTTTSSKGRRSPPTGNEPKTPIPKLRTASDVLERLRWDPGFETSHFSIGYLERFDGIKEMPVDFWIQESTDEEFIPQHRIKYFKRVGSGEVVWSREGRTDRIFGSGLGSGGGDGGGSY